MERQANGYQVMGCGDIGRDTGVKGLKMRMLSAGRESRKLKAGGVIEGWKLMGRECRGRDGAWEIEKGGKTV